MFYIGLWIRILRFYLIETLLLLMTSLVLFFLFLDNGELDLLQKKLWPEFKSDYYFTMVIESIVPVSQIEKIVKETAGIKSASLIDSTIIQNKLRQRLLDKRVYLNSEAIVKKKTYIKIFLNEEQDIVTMPIVKRKFLEKLSSYKVESSPIKTLRKSLQNNQVLRFLREWSSIIFKVAVSVFWLVVAVFYSRKTKMFLLLCEKFKFKKDLRSKVFIFQMLFCFISMLVLKSCFSLSPQVGSLIASLFLLFGICGLYHLWVSKMRLPW